MMQDVSKAAKELARLIGESDRRKADVRYGTVTSVGDGAVNVLIDGSDTPVAASPLMASRAGDRVRVSVSNHAVVVTGNSTAPATDDATAIAAYDWAERAREAAGNAQKSADDAGSAAANAQKSADDASAQAESASKSASTALRELSTVQDVAGTLEWITAHGRMDKTTDTEVDPTAVYFVKDENGQYTAGGVSYSIVEEPTKAGLGTYYELYVDESINNYVYTHLAATEAGLWIVPEESSLSRILVSTGGSGDYPPGTHIVGSDGTILASFADEGISFDDGKTFRIGDDSAFILFDGKGNLYINGDGVTIGGDKKLSDLLTVGDNVVYIEGTQAASTAAWTGSTSELSAIKAGTQIVYRLPYASKANVTLNLTLANGVKTGAKNCYYIGTTRLGTQYGAGAIVSLVYDGSSWRVANPYTNSNTYDRVKYANAITVKEAVSKDYPIFVGDDDGYEPLSAGAVFDIGYPVLYYASKTELAAGATTTECYVQMPSVSLRNTVADVTLTKGAMAYIKGRLAGSTFTVDSTDVFSVAPTSADGCQYIPVGVLYSTYQVYFAGGAPTVWEYGDDGFAPLPGPKGEQGIQGEKGDKGDKGDQGHTPEVTTVKNSDGSVTIYVDGVEGSTVDAGEDGKSPVVTTKKNSDGSVSIYIDGALSSTVEAGADGKDGTSVTVKSIQYGTSSGAGTGPSSWSTTVPTSIGTGKWLWVKTNYSDGKTATTKSYVGTNGTNGTNGKDGANGISVTAVEHQYYLSTSSTSQTDGSWSTTPADYIEGRYYWERWKVTLSNGDVSYTEVTLAKEVTSAWTAIERTNTEVALKANSSDVYTKTDVDDKITQEVSDRNAAITAKADEITSTVSETYATKTELTAESNQRKAAYGTSTTAAATATKVVSCSNFALHTGATITVRFDKGNTAASPKLNVNKTGAKPVVVNGSATPTADQCKWSTSATCMFTYDGSQWRLVGTDEDVKRIASAESSITQQAGQISSKVSTTDYTGAKIASLINQSADTVTIEAEHIDLNGSVKVSDLSQDTKDSIDDAAKTATDFVTLDAGGIVVGKLTDSTLGNNVLIDSDSVDIRDGSDVLASFGETVTVGSEDAAHVGITSRSMSVSDSDSTFFVAGDIRDENDYVTVTERVFVTSQGVTINTSFPIVSVRRILGTGIGTSKGWEFDAESFSGTSIVVHLPQGSYLPKGAALDVTYTTADYSQTHVLSFGKPRTGGGMNALLVDGDGSIDTIGEMHANGRGMFDEGIETSNSVVAGSISTQAADLVFGVPAYNNVFRRLVFTSIGNLRLDTGSDGETWAADSYFVHAPASLGTGAAEDYVVEVGSNSGTTANPQWRWMKFASGYAIAWGYYSGGKWAATEAWGSLYFKETSRVDNPFTWASAPYEWMQPRGTSYFWCVNHNEATTSQTGTYYLMSPTKQTTARAATLNFLQIGRWK